MPRDPLKQRMKAWADAHGYRQLKGSCACSLRRGGRQVNCRCHQDFHDVVDHAKVWRRQDGSRFLLSHTYRYSLDKATKYATDHGLRFQVECLDDGWYGFGTTAVRWWVNDPAT